jgi:cell division protein FtsI (penicillin-binding protein 3)
MDDALRLLDVPPDNVQNWYAAAPAAPRKSAPQILTPDEPVDVAAYAEEVPQ